jgi:sterol desaturase/sphingolipid hydroxylase (fatty acid hydroxylase superfamily)
MNQFTDFITRYNSQTQLFLFIGLLFIAWNIENAFGIILNYKKWKHALSNGLFIFTNLPGQMLLGLFFVKTIHWTGEHHFGVLQKLNIKNPVLLFILTFILLDLGEYIYHVSMHKIKRLWMFHVVHHSDSVVDVSTTLREHPGENIIRLCFTLLWVFLSGTVFWALVLRQIIQVFTTLFAHINYRLPDRIDNIVGTIFITPNLHQVHHHYKQPYTDCNYGDVLSIWDRLFGTFKELPAQDLIFGVDTYMQKEDTENFKSLVTIPFGKYKDRKNFELSNNIT